MDRSQAQENFRTWTTDLEKIQGQMNELHRREAGLAKMLEGLVDLFPDLARKVSDADTNSTATSNGPRSVSPRGKEAVTRVLAENPQSYLTVAEVVVELTKLGWISRSLPKPEEATRTTIGRMKKAGLVERRKRGNAYAYRLKSYGNSEALSGTEGF